MSDLTGYSAPENLYIGTAGWSLARGFQQEFPTEGTHLDRYASVFRAVEINSSFHRPHRVTTYAKWAERVPESFRFSVKLPKTITHEKRLVDTDALLDKFLAEVAGLGDKLGALLVQIPPSMEYDHSVAENFFRALDDRSAGPVVLEPRHSSWFGRDAHRLMQEFRVAIVAADPAVIPVAAEPGGWPGRVYYRLHGSPQIYYSTYTEAYLDGLAFRLQAYTRAAVPVWCIFDNTIRGGATVNALHVVRKIALAESGRSRPTGK